jgi:hypothetical protein
LRRNGASADLEPLWTCFTDFAVTALKVAQIRLRRSGEADARRTSVIEHALPRHGDKAQASSSAS